MLSKKSKMKDILKDQAGKAILEKYFGEKLKDPKLKMAMGFSLEKIGKMAKDQMPEGIIDQINTELLKLDEVLEIKTEQIESVESRQEINDNWLFTKEGTDAKGLGLGFEEITLPHTWNADDGNTGGSDYYRGLCTYKKSLHISSDYKDKKLYLEFGAANSIAKVYVNGAYVGKHIGGYSLFRMAITEFVKYDEANMIVVKVDNSHIEEVYPLMADFTFFGGLYRGASLLAVNNLHIDLEDFGSQGVRIDQKTVTKEKADVQVACSIVNQGEVTIEATVTYTLYAMDGLELQSKSLTSNVMESSDFIESFVVDQPKLWHGVINPYLYRLETTVAVNDVIVDRRDNKIGLRFYEIDPQKGFYLNGESYKLNGVSRHQDRAERGWALTKEDQIEDMELINEIGANSIRLAHYQHNPYFYELCDEYGMVIWAEIPLISRSSKTDITGENAKSQMIELVKQNINYSSILMWGVQNETTIGGKKNRLEEITTELHDLTKALDPYRVTTQAQVGHHPDDDSMNSITDILAYNKYYGWYYDTCEDFDTWLHGFNEKNPGLSLGISEYGCEGILDYHTETPECKDYSEEYQALYHEKVLQIFNRHDEIWGTYVWNMFDFASDLRDEGGVQGMNNKGLMTHDRKTRKDSFYYYKAMWSTEPVVHITSKRFVERVNEKIDIKVYSNQGSVNLKVNGQFVGEQETKDCIAIFTDVELSDGENRVIVESGNHVDQTVFKHVESLSVDYTCPEEAGSMMGNWFGPDVVLDENVQPIQFPEGYYTINDPIEDILANPQGEEVLRKYIAPMFDHPMFDMAKSFSIKMIHDFDKEAMNDVMVYNISKEINLIKK